MSKKSTTYLLFPGENAWEFWPTPEEGAMTPSSSHMVSKPGDIDKIPTGDVIFFFPVKSFTALPQHVPTADHSLFEDLANTHIERAGFRPDPMAGQLTDIFPVTTAEDESTFLSIILRNPQVGDFPSRSPKAFDVSPRAYPITGDTLSIWRELGAWVFSLHQDAKLLYCQATSVAGTTPDLSLFREIRIAITQLSLQGVSTQPKQAIIWSDDSTIDSSEIEKVLKLPTEQRPRQAPVLPETLSKLLPADVRAARREARQRQITILSLAALALVYVGTVGFLGFQVWKKKSTTQELLAKVQEIAPEGAAYATHIAKWDELERGIDLNYNPIDILNRIATSIPQSTGLRLRTAEISSEEIILIGEAPQPQAANQFDLNLKNNNDLANFEWENEPPRQTAKGWEFRFNGSTPKPLQ